MFGILTYFAVFMMTAIWVLGWMGLSVIAGSFFNLPLKTISLVGATLGPLGFVITILVGVLERKSTIQPVATPSDVSMTESWDPFG